MEAPWRDVISILQAETWQWGHFPKGLQGCKADAACLRSGSAVAWLGATWVQVGERVKGLALGSCCWARAVLSYQSLDIWSRGRSSCMPVTAWQELAELTETEESPAQTLWRFASCSLSWLLIHAMQYHFKVFVSLSSIINWTGGIYKLRCIESTLLWTYSNEVRGEDIDFYTKTNSSD